MSGYVNKVILLGNLGKDPEINSMSNGKKVMSFSLATSEQWVDKNTNEKVTKTEWHNVVVFSEPIISSLSSYLSKGSKIYLEGSIRTRKWVDSNRNDRYTTEVVLQGYNAVIRLLSSKRADGDGDNFDRSASEDNKGSKNISDLEAELADDEIPF